MAENWPDLTEWEDKDGQALVRMGGQGFFCESKAAPIPFLPAMGPGLAPKCDLAETRRIATGQFGADRVLEIRPKKHSPIPQAPFPHGLTHELVR